jgi:hypothetical protein
MGSKRELRTRGMAYRFLTTGLALCLLTGAAFAQGTGSSYLEELEREAQSFKHLENAERLDAENATRSELVMERRLVTPGLTITEFAQELSERFAGTGMLYHSLPQEAKEAVYRDYQNDNRISVIRKNVAFSM